MFPNLLHLEHSDPRALTDIVTRQLTRSLACYNLRKKAFRFSESRLSQSQAEAGELALSTVCHSVSGTDSDNPFYFLLITVS